MGKALDGIARNPDEAAISNTSYLRSHHERRIARDHVKEFVRAFVMMKWWLATLEAVSINEGQ
jgi:hypothetical protein